MTETLPQLLALQACDQRIQHLTRTVATLRQSLAMRREAEQTMISGQIATAEAELRAARRERLVLGRSIGAALLQEYERIFARRNGIAVAAIVHETCQGCHLRLPPQFCLEIQKSPRLVFCPHCHRIVFAAAAADLDRAPLPPSAGPTDSHSPPVSRRQPRAKSRVGRAQRVAALPRANPASL